MKKKVCRYLALAMSLVMLLSVFAGCSKKQNTSAPTVPTNGTDSLTGITGRDYAVALDLYLEGKSSKTFSQYIAAAEKNTNTLLDENIKALYAVLRRSDTYLSEDEKEYNKMVDANKAAFGDDYKVSYRIITEEPLDKAAVEAFQSKLDDMAESMEFSIDAMKGFDEEKWEEVGQIWGLSAEDTKAFLQVTEDACAKLKTLQVTEGYWLDVRFLATGSKSAGQQSMVSEEVRVFKVNGKWICGDSVNPLLALTEFNGY